MAEAKRRREDDKRDRTRASRRDRLNDDVTVEIFSRLPLKSLMRFKGVCRSWISLVTTSDHLVRLHRIRGGDNRSVALVHAIGDQFSLLSTYTFDVIRNVNVPLSFRGRERSSLKIVGSTNGIVCLKRNPNIYDNSLDLVLWNPATREWWNVPRPPSRVLDILDYWDVFGFGYDSRSNCYKIVRICSRMWPGKNGEHHQFIDVYSTGCGFWREIRAPYVRAFPRCCCCASTDGVVCWLALKEKAILSFDLHEEAFVVLPVPPVLHSSRYWLSSINFAGHDRDVTLTATTKRRFEVWRLKLDGNNVWIKRWEMRNSMGNQRPFWLADRVLFDTPGYGDAILDMAFCGESLESLQGLSRASA